MINSSTVFFQHDSTMQQPDLIIINTKNRCKYLFYKKSSDIIIIIIIGVNICLITVAHNLNQGCF